MTWQTKQRTKKKPQQMNLKLQLNKKYYNIVYVEKRQSRFEIDHTGENKGKSKYFSVGLGDCL